MGILHCNYKLTDLRKEVVREFYKEMRRTPRLDSRGNLSEKSVEGLHNTLCSILSAAVDEGYLTHNPAWRCYKPKGQKKERPVADEESTPVLAILDRRAFYKVIFSCDAKTRFVDAAHSGWKASFWTAVQIR